MKQLITLLVWIFSVVSAYSLFAQDTTLRVTGGTYIGGANNFGYVTGMTRDDAGNVYCVSVGSDMPATPGAYQTQRKGPSDICVFKLSSDLSRLIWCTYIGGSAAYQNCAYCSYCQDLSTCIKVNSSGEVYITGTTHSTDFPITSGTNHCSSYCYDSTAIFVAKFNASGSQLLFSTILGYTYAYGSGWYFGGITMCLSPTGDVYVVSSVSSNGTAHVDPQYIITANAVQPTRKQGYNPDMVVTKMSGSGSILYSSYVGGAGSFYNSSICYGDNGLYISGYSQADDFPIVGSMHGYFILRMSDGPNQLTVSDVFDYGTQGTYYYYPVIDYDKFSHKLNACVYQNSTSGAVRYLQVFDPALSGVLTNTLLSTNYYYGYNSGIHVGSDGKKYVGSLYGFSIYDASATQLLYSYPYSNTYYYYYGYGYYYGGWGSNNLAPLEHNGGCDVDVVVGGAFAFDSLHPHKTAYQKSKANADTMLQAVVVRYGMARRDTLKYDTVAGCGDYQFFNYTVPCRAAKYVWNFSDGTGYVTTPDSIKHHFDKNGQYEVQCFVIYGPGDTVFTDTTIFVKSHMTMHLSPQNIYRCSKDSGQRLHAFGGVRYEWHPGETLSDSTIEDPIAKPTKNMKYYVRAYNMYGCYVDDSVQVYMINPVARVNTTDTTICEGSSVTLTASGAAEFAWSPPDGLNTTKKGTVIAKPTKTTTYTVAVYEANCPDTARVRVRIAHKPQLQLNPASVVCVGGSAKLSAFAISSDPVDTTGMRYKWSPAATLNDPNSANPTASPLTTTRYICEATNAYGCVARDSVQVTVQNSLNLKLNPDTATCAGSTLHLSATGGAMYSWTPKTGLDDSTLATPLCTAQQDQSYTVITWSGDYATATCRDTAVVRVSVYSFPKVHASGGATVCSQTPVMLHARVDSSSHSAGALLQWTLLNGDIIGAGDSIEVSPQTTSSYIARLSNEQGCVSTDTIVVVVSNFLSVHANAIAAVLPNTQVLLSVAQPQSGTSYYWYDATHTLLCNSVQCSQTVSTPSWFYVRAQNGNCEGNDSVFVGITDIVHVQACQDLSLCKGDPVQLQVLNPQQSTQYSWSDEHSSWTATGDTVRFIADHTTNYIVRAVQGSNASLDTVAVVVYDLPTVAVADTNVCSGAALNLQVKNASTDVQYEWRDEAGRLAGTGPALQLQATRNTRYAITARNSHGCTATTQMDLGVDPRQHLDFSLQLTPNIYVTKRVYTDVMMQSQQALKDLHVQAHCYIPRRSLHCLEGVDQGSERMLSIDTILSMQPGTIRIARFEADALLSHDEVNVVRLGEVVTNMDPACSDFTTQPHTFSIDSVCGNDFFRVTLVEQHLSIAPNPSSHEVSIQCTSPIRIVDAIGHEISLADAEFEAAGDMTVVRLRNLPSGMYFVHMASPAGPFVEKLMVIR